MYAARHLRLAVVALLAGGILFAQEGTDAPPPSKTIIDYRTELNLSAQQQGDIRARLDQLQENWLLAW